MYYGKRRGLFHLTVYSRSSMEVGIGTQGTRGKQEARPWRRDADGFALHHFLDLLSYSTKTTTQDGYHPQ